jgi:hypothetical protein
MGHYKAASFSKEISSFYVARLTACGRKGLPLKWWGTGLTVLIEKTPGNNFINKMRAIVLLEADFNYYMKTIFCCANACLHPGQRPNTNKNLRKEGKQL